MLLWTKGLGDFHCHILVGNTCTHVSKDRGNNGMETWTCYWYKLCSQVLSECCIRIINNPYGNKQLNMFMSVMCSFTISLQLIHHFVMKLTCIVDKELTASWQCQFSWPDTPQPPF